MAKIERQNWFVLVDRSDGSFLFIDFQVLVGAAFTAFQNGVFSFTAVEWMMVAAVHFWDHVCGWEGYGGVIGMEFYNGGSICLVAKRLARHAGFHGFI